MSFSTDLQNKINKLNIIVAKNSSDRDKGKEIFNLFNNWNHTHKLKPARWGSSLISPNYGYITTQNPAFYDDFYIAINECINQRNNAAARLIGLISQEVDNHQTWLTANHPSRLDRFNVSNVGKRQLSTFFLMLCRPDDFIYLPNPLFDYVGNLRTSAGNPITWDDYNNYITYTLQSYMNANGIGNFLDLCDAADNGNANIGIGGQLNQSNINNVQQQNTDLPLNLILYGPPGTGKTYSVTDYAYAITNKLNINQVLNDREDQQAAFIDMLNRQIIFITFHQSYSYEEFVEGIRARTLHNGAIQYFIRPGIFKTICEAANKDLKNNYVLIIDEINRGNISKIFGELITLIEPSKRTGEPEQLSVTLPYSGDSFSVPNNLYIIGTMNTADRSLTSIDTALRRRFDFIEMQSRPELLTEIEVEGVNIELMLTKMNQRIEVLYDREHTLGHAFFMHLDDDSTIADLAVVFERKIIPLLQEYFFEDWEKIRIVLGDDQKPAVIDQFVIENAIPANIFSGNVVQNYRLQNVVTYSINPNAFTNPASYQQI